MRNAEISLAGYRIRSAQPGDVDTLIAFTLREGRDGSGTELSADAVRRGVMAAFDHPRRATYWVVESGDQVVAAASIVTEWSNFYGADYWWIQSIFIVDAHRGTGLLDTILDHLASEARAAGALDLRLYAHAGNERALRAYRRCGFAEMSYRFMHRPIR